MTEGLQCSRCRRYQLGRRGLGRGREWAIVSEPPDPEADEPNAAAQRLDEPFEKIMESIGWPAYAKIVCPECLTPDEALLARRMRDLEPDT